MFYTILYVYVFILITNLESLTKDVLWLKPVIMKKLQKRYSEKWQQI
jgi:hypothetical protein